MLGFRAGIAFLSELIDSASDASQMIAHHDQFRPFFDRALKDRNLKLGQPM
jgi:hypothetical protein